MSVRLYGQENFFRDMSRMTDVAKKEMEKLVHETAERFAASVRTEFPSVSGKLRSGIEVVYTANKEGFKIDAKVIARPFHAWSVDFGYKGRKGKGNRGHHMPIEKVGGRWRVKPDFEQWARRHGIPAWAAARKRLQEGQKTPGRKVYSRTAGRTRPGFIESAQFIVDFDIPAAGASPAPAALNKGVE